MRITNKIMHNNSIYNINNNKVSEDTINTQIATGKKINRASDDPVIAIRALRLRSNVSQLTQYSKKNAEDAASWLKVTEDALGTVTDVLTAMISEANKAANTYKELPDFKTMITELDALSREYYATGNEDYAGRYIFTGYRTGNPLTFKDAATLQYKNIHDEFNARDVDVSKRIVNAHKLAAGDSDVFIESDIEDVEVGRVRLSYEDLADTDTDSVRIQYRKPLAVDATAELTKADVSKSLQISFKDSSGTTHRVNLSTGDRYDEIGNTVTVTEYDEQGNPTDIKYNAQVDTDGTFRITGSNDGGATNIYDLTIDSDGVMKAQNGTDEVKDVVCNISKTALSTVTFKTDASDPYTVTIKVPLTEASDSPYTVEIPSTRSDGSAGDLYTITVNTDGTFHLESPVTGSGNASDPFMTSVVNLSTNGSINSSYIEHTLVPDGVITVATTEDELDNIYRELADGTSTCYLNAVTGEVLMNNELKTTLTALTDVHNAKTIDVVYSKTAWKSGDTRPENLMKCTNWDGKAPVVFNGGISDHIMEYDVGYGQTIEVNTTADEVFTTNVARDVEDLKRVINKLSDVTAVLGNLKAAVDSATNDTDRESAQKEYDAAAKAKDYLIRDLKDMCGSKITSFQRALDKANVAVSENGTRSSRLDMISTRLTNQLTTFKELQSNNEDTDLAEAATDLNMAKLQYQASLMATGKILQNSLMDYI
ncbi:flagellin N-terminal helical domain-containing protein [Butyrivibrio sp. NC3005]|uniref:flagellin N-terminal helical domain-containing protein n=1 Tax=Butyrivibrio sp. NC3005 TaxID=1280685 RepID=UPI00041D3186|nr:flagellin [Butyrivibrio sp. NC3005]